MNRGDLLGAAIVLCSGVMVGALWVVERPGGGSGHAGLDGEPLVPLEGADFPEDSSEFMVLRGELRVGTVTGTQGRSDSGDAWSLHREMKLDASSLAIPGIDLPADLAVSSLLDMTLATDLTLATFRFRADGPAGPLVEANGLVDGPLGRVSFRIGSRTEELVVPLASAPLVEEAALALLAAGGGLASPGKRYRMPILDPSSGDSRTLLMEVGGAEIIELADGAAVPAVKVFRDAGDGLPRPVWVDARGRMLKETMPLGLISLRRKPPEAAAVGAP